MTFSQRFGPYTLLRQVGRGGMGEVFLARDERHPERAIALKKVWVGAAPDSQEILEAEHKGAELQKLVHAVEPRVVGIHELGYLEDYFYVDMEYVEGQDLASLLKQGPLPPHKAVRLGIELAEILARVHTLHIEFDQKVLRGVIHGDIKPRNIRVDTQGRLRLLDFGIARALSMTRRLTRNEFGSAAYASPERLETGEVNEHSDLWSTAVVIFEMLTGRVPFRGDTTSEMEKQIRARRPLPAPGPETPPELQKVLAKATAARLEDRYPSAVHLKKDLQAVYRRLAMDLEPSLLEDGIAQAQAASASGGVAEAVGTGQPVAQAQEAMSGATRRSMDPAAATRRSSDLVSLPGEGEPGTRRTVNQTATERTVRSHLSGSTARTDGERQGLAHAESGLSGTPQTERLFLGIDLNRPASELLNQYGPRVALAGVIALVLLLLVLFLF